MISKPGEPEPDSRAREAVRQAKAAGDAVGQTAREAGGFVLSGLWLWLLVMFGVGLLMSGVPWWFKLACLGVIFGIFRLTRPRRR